jgi:DNA-nicking Smr family endonuclease
VRPLSPDEARLWAQVAATIRPLSREQVQPNEAAPVRKTLPRTQPQRIHKATKSVPIAQKTLDGSWDKKLRSGSVTPDRVLDLHGMNLDSAWQAIDQALEQAFGAGDRILLLITGHHRPGAAPVQRGRIRAAVHDWLTASRHAPRIGAVRGAHRRHGGGGSLYIILKRR